MFLAGLAAFAQITILPGLIVSRIMGLGAGAARTLACSFALSLIINYHLVLLLTISGRFDRSALIAVLAIETAALSFLFRKGMSSKVGDAISAVRSRLTYLIGRMRSDKDGPALFMGAVAILVMLIYLSVFILSIGGIFDDWDDVVSWNRWAADWFSGRIPSLTWHYPQLLPANWSVTYGFMNDGRIQFFAKSISSLFPFFSILIVFDLWLRKGMRGYLYAVPILGMMLGAFAGKYLSKGYADVPVCFMALVAMYPIVLLEDSESASRKLKMVYLGTLFSAGAGLTKQSGLYFAAVYPLLSYLTTIRKIELLKTKRFLVIASQCAMLVVLVLPWYLYAEHTIRAGSNESEISYITGATHSSQNLLERPRYAVNILVNTACSNITALVGFDGGSWTRIAVIAFLFVAFFALAYSMKVGICRYLALFIVTPYFIIWSLFFSYDVRNLTPLFPFAAICVGHGFNLAIGPFRRKMRTNGNVGSSEDNVSGESGEVRSFAARGVCDLKISIIALPVVLMLAAMSYFYDDGYLIQRQLRLQRDIWDPETNAILYKLPWDSKDEIVVTDYQILRHLPGLENRAVVVDTQNDKNFFDAIASGRARYICFARGRGSENVLNYIIAQLNEGRYRFISDTNGWVIVRAF